MARDTWQLLRNVFRTTKIRKTITIPAASYECFEDKGCVRNQDSAGTTLVSSAYPAAFNFTTAMSAGVWVKALSISSVSVLVGRTGKFRIQLSSVLGARGQVDIGATPISTPSGTIKQDEWNYLMLTFDNVNAYFYINGELIGSVAAVGPLDAGSSNLVLAGQGSSLVFFSEVSLWNRCLELNEIVYIQNKPKGVIVDSSLVGYWKFNEGLSATTVSNKNTSNVADFAIDQNATMFVSDYPPLIYGASFVVAQTDITLGKATSLIFPKEAPEGLTGQFCVSWTDRTGTFQRRKLWTTAGADVNPALLAYAGERLESPFRLELWNIDGETTCVIPSDVVFEISDTTDPTSGTDRTQIAAVTPTIDTTLAQPFPLTPFPLTFNSQQTY